MLDYENNMRDDQADELTAATYVRETGLSDAELETRGLMRNASRSKRGALIGRHAREELWTRFSNGKLTPKDAEIICNLTRYIKDQTRIDEIQRRCCMLLDSGKSWDFIGGMVQLMVQAELEQGQQGWFNFGADFEAALERAATWIEKALKAVNENIALAKSGRDMSGKKAAKAARLGISTNAGDDVLRTLQDLQILKGKLELIGSYPELRQQAEMWDGESEVDPIAWMLQQQAIENERLAAEKEMQAEEFLKAQQAAATGEFSFSIVISKDRICNTRAEARAMVGRKGTPLKLENRFLDIEAVFNAKSEGKFSDKNSIGRTFEALADSGLSDDEIKRVHYTAFGNVERLFANAESMKFERAYKKKEERKGFLQVFSPFEVEDWNTSYVARIELEIHQESGHLPTAYLLNVSIEKQPLFLGRRGAGAEPFNRIEATRIREDFPGIVKENQTVSFSVVTPEMDARNLAAVHSIPLDTMLQVEKTLGGLAKPSVAITRLDKPYSWGGTPDRVYLVGSPELADPQKGNLVYDRDAWTGKGPFLMESGGAYDYLKGEYFEPTLEEFVARTIKKKGMEEGSDLRAQSAVPVSTMEAVKAHRDMLTDTDTSNLQKQETEAALDSLIEDVVNLSKKGLNYEAVAYILAKICWRSSPMEDGAPSQRDVTRDQAKRILNEMGIRVKDIKKPLVDKFVKAVGGLKNELEDYLESVPQRAVMFNEFEYAVMPESAKGTAGLNEMLQRNGIKPIFHDGTEEGRKAALAGLVNDARVSFSVVGEHAANWDKIKHRAFKGRDDGKLRVEIDASQAKLKWEDLRGRNVAAYRRIVEGWDKLPDNDRKAVEDYAELVYDWQDAREEMNNTPENEFLEQYNKVVKMRDAIKPKRAEIRSLLNKLLVEHGGSAAAVLNMKDGEVDELAMSLWGPIVESKVEDVLDLRPLWNGGMRLADVLDYPELYEAYPELASVTVRYVTMDNANGRAIYGNGELEIQINRNLEGEWQSIHSILLHEIQHHIQNIEGFAKGTNNRNGMDAYMRSAGEIEARNVQSRYGWSMDKREAIPFNDTLEYPGEALVSFSMTRAAQRSLELLESRSEEEVAQQIMDDLRKACERLAVVLADDGADSQRGEGLRVYAEMQALLSAVRQALPENYLKQGNLEMLLRWAAMYARMAQDGQVPAKGTIKGEAFEKFVSALTRQTQRDVLQGMSEEEVRDALMEMAGQKMELYFQKVARDSVQRIDRFLKDRALERIEWVYKHAYPTREEGKAWSRGWVARHARTARTPWRPWVQWCRWWNGFRASG